MQQPPPQPPYGYGPPAGGFGQPQPQPMGHIGSAATAMTACHRCGHPGADYFMPPNPPAHRACMGLGPDVLSPAWAVLAYVIVIPLGCSLVGALVASIPYYVWKRDYPNKARAYNRHVWIAFAISVVCWIALSMISRASR